jgi:multidrug efflux pump subunit AcrA (membrane-fusion protein)
MPDIEINDNTVLPDSHPLVKAYAAEREKNKTLKAEVAASADAVEKAKKYDELEAANRSELEKAQARAEAAEKSLKERQAADEKAKADAEAQEALDKERTAVAKVKGISATLLRGSSKEDFEKHADELIEAGIKATPAPSNDGQGDQGEPITGGKELTAAEVVAAATAR